MRARAPIAALSCALALSHAAAGQPSAPSGAPPSAAASSTATAGAADADKGGAEEAARHFKSGVKLYQDANFRGALAEFEEAQRQKPSARALQNIALCQKGLYRYAAAAETLHRLLREHDAELSDAQRTQVKAAIDELESLVGRVTLALEPPDAKLTIDGRAIDSAELAAGVQLDVGEHTLAVEAPGYRREARTFQVAGGRTLALSVTLVATGGFVEVVTNDRDAAIAVCGKERAFSHWRGALEPGRCLVQVYKRGFVTFEQAVDVQVGKTERVTAPALSPEPDGSADDASLPQRGWYALAALSAIGLSGAPSGLSHDGVKSSTGGGFGVRAGYRVWTPIGVELVLDAARHDISDACVGTGCSSGDTRPRQSYTLESLRLGGSLRVMSAGESLRFTSTAGAGVVRHTLTIAEPSRAAAGTLAAGTTRGIDPYFMLELGAQMNFGHWLAELDLVVYADGASAVKKSDFQPYEDTKGIQMVGLGLRGGWGEWTPKKPREPQQ